MHILIRSLLVAFALGGLVPLAVQAGEDCDYGSGATKNDFETPPPSSAASKPGSSGT